MGHTKKIFLKKDIFEAKKTKFKKISSMHREKQGKLGHQFVEKEVVPLKE